MKIYQFGDSPCCMKVRMALFEKGLEWEEVFIESWKFDHFQPDYLKLNPLGIVPTLVDKEKVLTQSNVIVEYLEDAYSAPSLRPEDAYSIATMRKWMFIEQDYLFRDIVTMSFNTMMKLRVEGFGLEQLKEWSRRHPDQEKAQDYLRRIAAPSDPEADESAQKSFRRFMLMLEQDLAMHQFDWICGKQFTLADICLAGIMDRIIYLDREELLMDLPRVQQWLDRLKQRDSYINGQHKFSSRMWGPKKPVSEYRDLIK
ncbi:maleylacetoacetate isomerase [Vibrio nigripulchritudo]|uniref:glutathione S-transferase family protein n=1 Tax=Vibrio nigripulchritudo TaxID=28173 RepID=UPI00190A6FD6|nr:glutathione S-transferase family protein [Vibrio nigripulchritudo]BCL73298.1 maleylacetoacetate isomerase [Vibrio nigripulchritudo]BDU34663.1 maleylacetoacetate isomerase [Vibrio nigripulchritudo]